MASLEKLENIPAYQQDQMTGWERFVRSSTPYWLIAPFFVGFMVFQLLPILFSGYLSLSEWDGMKGISFVGVDNFRTLLGDSRFWNAFQNTLLITLVCSVLGTTGALTLATLLEKVHDRMASILRVVFLPPLGDLGCGDHLCVEANFQYGQRFP